MISYNDDLILHCRSRCLCSWTLIIYCCWTVIIIECGQYLFRGTPDDFGKHENNKALWADQCVSVYPRPIRCHGKIDEQTELIMRNQLRGGNCPFRRARSHLYIDKDEGEEATHLARMQFKAPVSFSPARQLYVLSVYVRHNGRNMGILCFCCMTLGSWLKPN